MIVVRMRAGLGNQLFQYALGRRLAIENDAALKLDTRWYERSHRSDVTGRHFTLAHFDIEADVATSEDLRRIFNVRGVPVPRMLVHVLNRGSEVVDPFPTEVFPRLSASLLNYYWEIRHDPPPGPPTWPYGRQFCPMVLDLEGDVYLAGFWQSFKYFDDVADALREDLTVVDPLEGENARVADAIDETTAVGVHVRRGDFADGGGALPATYYENAASRIEAAVDEPAYFVFSNDPDWAESNLRLGEETTFVRHNDGSTDYEDLRLLRRCDHQINADSTFSWWAAWLNENPDKRVLVPWPRTDRQADFLPEPWESVDH